MKAKNSFQPRRPADGPLWQTITEELALEITGGRYRRGDRFYSQRELCERYGVSTITSVRVLDELAGRDLIEKIQGKGCLVARTVVDRDVLLVCRNPAPARGMESPPTIFGEVVQGLGAVLARYTCRLKPVAVDVLINAKNVPAALCVAVYGAGLVEALRSLAQTRGYTCVVCHAPRACAGLSTVREDLKTAVYLGVSHLLARGHTRIGYMTSRINDEWYADRFLGYQRALEERGIALDLQLVKETRRDAAEDRDAVRDLLALPDPPTAVFAANHERGLRALAYCREHGIAIPTDLALATFDNVYETSICDPPLTVVDSFWRKEGEEGARLLLELAEEQNPEPRDVLIAPEVVVRQST
ncbi:MAG: GntR family transcriptional regulator [Kiritimatiellae bacterium]|nr:GntR family transcriptional regulator [Kiritimatiellia bacterium]